MVQVAWPTLPSSTAPQPGIVAPSELKVRGPVGVATLLDTAAVRVTVSPSVLPPFGEALSAVSVAERS